MPPNGSGTNTLILQPTQLTIFYINNCPTRYNTKSLFIILQVHSTCFGCQPYPSSGVHKTVNTASVTGHIFCVATSLKCGQAWPRWREVAAQKYDQYRRL